METKQGKSERLAPKEQKPATAGVRSRLKDTWLGRNWGTVLILVAIILVALFVRSYFGFSTAVDNGFLVAGGSDSYYHQHVIDHIQDTGTHLVQDPMLNYPLGMRNARPPVYDWSVAVAGQVLSGISGLSMGDATGYSLLFSTAIWGALTCIPVFLITRAAFGTKAGLLAALLFAIMPGNIQRSVFADADHDAIVLFFVVFAFYFLLQALKSIDGTKWVSSWKDMGAVRGGIKKYASQNQKSLIYALLGGVCVATVGMTWTGYTYVLIIVLAYFLVQVIINRFRNVDSMGEFFVVGAMMASAFAIMAPLYWQMNYWGQWFDVPFYLFAATMLVGAIFTVTRDYPWTLVIPAVIGLIAVGLVVVWAFAPNLFEAIISGQGYLVKSKLYSTIQEAQAPNFSDLALSFGAVTFWLAIFGVAWAAIKIPKNTSPYLVFVVVWMGVSMYMAASAARFMFNASPAFAMAAGWVLALFLGLIKFEDMTKALSGFRSNPLGVLRKAVKLRHVAAVLFLAFLILLPNIWGAVDAGIPSEDKREYDKQIYYALPDILHPADYDRINGSFWYLGAFAYSLPLPSGYWPAAWDWFSQQDADVSPEQDKPAFLSWWDYGFEAIQAGEHPTVADNFQNAYQYAGSFITSQNETDAVALFIIRLLESEGFNDNVKAAFAQAAPQVDVAKLQDIMSNPSAYIDEVKAHPEIYGPYDSDLSAQNAKYAAARVELEKAPLENLVELYRLVRIESGKNIGYFAVDSRLFPFSATSNNIFYAPATLSDRNIDPQTNAPSDYYEIRAVTADGQTKPISELTSSDTVINYAIVYKEAFYDTMLYRAMMGFGPSDLGLTSQGIPGISGSLASYSPLPAWNLTHFKQVYRTAYYNPYNSSEVASHADAWRAISYDEAQYLQSQIANGTASGTVDLSASTLMNGVVFLQYYDGAVVEGRATSNDGTPYSGIHVTVVDEYGTPHQTVRTDENGHYSVILPFGENVSVVYSAGTLNKRTLVATEMERRSYNISYAQAMRAEPYTYNGDIVLPGSTVQGSVFWDNDGNGRYTDGVDEYIQNATVTLENPNNGFKQDAVTDSQGAYKITGLAGDNNNLYATYQGHKFGEQSIPMSPYGSVSRNIALKPASISGTLTFASGGAAPNVEMSLRDKTSGEVLKSTTAANGAFSFDKLMPGEYSLAPTDVKLTVGEQTYNLSAGDRVQPSLKLFEAAQVSGQVTIDGVAQANVPVGFLSQQREVWTRTNANGNYTATMPEGDYTAYAVTVKDGTDYAAMQTYTADSESGSLDLVMQPASVVSGTVNSAQGQTVSGATVIYTTPEGAQVKATTNSTGQYRLALLPNTYFVYASGNSKAFWDTVQLDSTKTVDLNLVDSTTISGTVYRDIDGNSAIGSGEGLANAAVRMQNITNPERAVTFLTDASGKYSVVLPKGLGYNMNVSLDGYYSQQKTYDPLNSAVSENISLSAVPRTVTGTVEHEGTPIDGTISFNANGGGAVSQNATISGGSFSVDLAPGAYTVVIDQLVGGDEARKYTYNGTLTVPVARDPEAMEIDVVEKVRVNGTIATSGSGTVRFVGPENRTVSASSAFPIYLQPGEYTVYADVTSGSAHYAYLGTQTVNEGADLSINTVRAYALNGQLQYDGGDLNATADVTVTNGTASLPLKANNQGEFVVYLPNATYEVSAEHHVKTAVDGLPRYVVYTGTTNTTVSGLSTVDVALDRDYDNATLSGSITGASSGFTLEFDAISDTAMDTTASASSGSYSVTLAPGTYAVYGTDGSNVYLDTIVVQPYKDNEANLTMETGYTVDGTVTYDNGQPMDGAEITFSDVVPYTVTADSNGDYSVVLPSGRYNVSASGVVEEEPGVNVTWARSFDLELESSTTRDIELVRQLRGVVEVYWDPSSKQTISPGESVTYDVTVYNRGNVDDTYRLSSDSSWNVTFSKNEVTLPWGSGSSETIQVTITAPADAKVNHPAIKIKAVSTNNSGASDTENVDVGITPTYSVDLGLGSAESTNGTAYTLPVMVKNTGNADDTFNFTLDQANIDALAAQGWDVSIQGSTKDYKVVTVQAGKNSTINVVMTKNRESPATDVALKVAAASTNSNANAEVPLQRLQLDVPNQELTVSGDGISMNAPQIPGTTWVLLALIMLLLVALVMLRVNKGVFGRRRKR